MFYVLFSVIATLSPCFHSHEQQGGKWCGAAATSMADHYQGILASGIRHADKWYRMSGSEVLDEQTKGTL